VFASSSLLAPQPLNPARFPETPPAIIQPNVALMSLAPSDPAPPDPAPRDLALTGLAPIGLASRNLAQIGLEPTPGILLSWLPTTWTIPPGISAGSSAGALPVIQAAPEPSSVGLFLAGITGLLTIRHTMRGLAYTSGGVQPTSAQTNLSGRSPVL